MSIADFFFGRKQNSNNNRRSDKFNRKSVRSRTLSMEPLETRDLLSVTTGPINAAYYSQLRAQYPEFDLPVNQADLNVMTVSCNLSDLKSAISTAGSTEKPDLILVTTTSSSNSITLSSEISLNIDPSQKGSITIIGYGTNQLTLNANSNCRVMSISGATDAYLGNMIMKNGKVTASSNSGNNNLSVYGGGICSTSTGVLTLNSCTITNNTLSSSNSYSGSSSNYAYGGGIYSSANKALTLTDCTISSNAVSSSSNIINTSGGSFSTSSYSYGGGIYYSFSSGALTLNSCTISGNSLSSSAFKQYTSQTSNSYSYGGGIYSTSKGSLTLNNCVISNNTLSANGSKMYTSGSAIYNQNALSSLSIIDSSITSNSSTTNLKAAGKVLIKNSALNSTNITISGGDSWSIVNSSMVGTGTSGINGVEITSGNLSSNLTISNSLIRNFKNGINTTATFNANIVNSTITNNAYGLYIDSNAPIFNVYNSIIAQHSSSDVYKTGGTVNAYYTLSSYSDWTNKDAATNYAYNGSQTLFESDYTLSSNSQALNKGNPVYLLEYVDLAGNERIQGITLDLGAYEYNESSSSTFPKETPSVVVNTLDDVVDEYDGKISLREAIMLYAGTNNLGTVITFAPSVCDGQTISLCGMPVFIRKSVTLDASSLENKLTIDAASLGRAIQMWDDDALNVSIKNINITGGNTSYGAAVYNRSGAMELDSCNIINNAGNGIYNIKGTMIVSNSTVSNNTAAVNGAGIYNGSGVVTVSNSAISNNTTSGSNLGGGIYSSSGQLTIASSQILENTASNGGGVYNISGTVAISQSDINKNNAGSNTGGLYNGSGTFTITASNIKENTGKGIYNNSGSGVIEDSYIDKNTVYGIQSNTSSGRIELTNTSVSNNQNAGVYFTAGTIIVNDGVITGNAGDGIYDGSGTVTIDDSDVSSNTGIGVNVDSGTVTIRTSEVYDNGGNGVNVVSGTVTIGDVEVHDNTGDGVFIGAGKVTINNIEATDNGGNGIFVGTTSSSMSLKNSTVSGNGAIGVYTDSANVTIDNLNVFENAQDGVYLGSTSSQAAISNTVIDNNGGNGLYNAYGSFTLTNLQVKNNHGSYGVYSNSNENTSAIINSSFTSNTGTGFYVNGGTTKIDRSIVSDNTNGGIDIGNAGYVAMSSSLVSNNANYEIAVKGTFDGYSNTIVGGSTADISCDGGFVMICNTIAPSIEVKNSGAVSGFNNLTSFTGWSSGSGNKVYDDSLELFEDADNFDFRLAENSQAIDQGNNRYAVDTALEALLTDLADVPRIQGDFVDIGAYEFDMRTFLSAPEFTLAIDESSVVVTIEEVENATGYQIEYAYNADFTDSVLVDAQAGENVLEDVLTSLSFYVRIKAVGDDVYTDSPFSEAQNIELYTEPPATPAVALSANTYDSVYFTITEVEDVTGYQIEYSTDESFAESTVIDAIVGENLVDGLVPDTPYYFRAYSVKGLVPSNPSEVLSVTLHGDPLPEPALNPLTVNGSEITATWSEVENASSYTIEYQVAGADGWSAFTGIQGTTKTFVGTLGVTYNVRVKAAGVGAYSDSDYSETQSVFVYIPITGLTLSADSYEVDSVITARLNPSDAAATYEWYCGTEIIDGATGSTFTITENQLGQTITCVATGTGSYSGVVSATTSPVQQTALDAPAFSPFDINNSIVVATWSEVDNASSYSFEYKLENSEIWTVITGLQKETASFIGNPGDTYNVRVKATGTGAFSDSEYSETASVFIPIPLTSLTLSTDAPEVGTTIDAILDQTDAAVSYQWYCGTAIIDGATDSSFTVTNQQIGQTITCIATGTGAYTGTVSATTAVVPALPLDVPNAPSLTVEGSSVTATWSAVDYASSYTVEYQAEGADGWTLITGVQGTTASFVGLAGATYNVRVKAVGTGAYSDSDFSESASVYVPIPLTGLTLSTIVPEVGTVINATLEQDDATAEYQWYCGTEIIDGANESSFTVTTDQIGYTITCIATGTDKYTGTAKATTAVVPIVALDAPVISSIDSNNSIVIVAWSAIDNADGYAFEYKAADSANWTTISGLQDTTASFIGNVGSTYYARVKAIGSGDYADSAYSAIASVTISVPLVPLASVTLSTETPVVGTVITTTLDPSDADVEYQWYSGSTLIDGATDSSFTVTEEQIGQTITCVATGTGDYTGTVSATTAVVPALQLTAPDAPALTVDGSIVTATWSAVENASSYTIEYQADGVDGWFVITGVNKTNASFAGITGATYNVRVKAVGTGYYSDSEFSESASAFISIPLSGLTLSTMAPEVDTVITASFDNSDVTANYQWYCGTEIIDGATDSSFTVTTDQIGQTITCVATGTGNYIGTVSVTTTVVPALQLNAPDAPALSVEGTTITATWSAVENASSYTVEYQVNGAAGWTLLTGISGTSVSFTGSANTSYNVCVKAVGTGIYSDSEFSDPSSVAIAIPLEGLTLSTTAPEVGTVITATLDQTDAAATYQWYSGDTIIDGATDASFTVTEEQIGQTITCIATGTGDYSGTARATTAVVPTIVLTTPSAPTFTIVDTVITATWTAVDNASSYTVEYQVNGADSWTSIDSVAGTSTTIDGTTGTTYNVRVKAVGTGYYSDSEFSESAFAYIPIPLTSITLSTTSPEVGTVITTTLGQADATASYQWYSGETAIDGATASSFTVTEDQIGKTITCVAAGTDKYTGTVSATTAVVPVVVLSAPDAPTFTISNTVITATWSAVSNASGYTFEYQPEGFDGWTTITGIRGTSTSFPGMIGTTYNVRVKAVGTGNYADSEYSELASVTLNNPLTGLTLSTTTPEVGTIITATISPANASATYQWYSGDTAIEGATASSFTVTENQIGKTISCAATGTGDYSGTIRVTTASVPALPLSAPTLNVSLKETGTVIVSVGSVENASGYTLDYSTNADFSNATNQNVLAGNTTISGLDANTVYYFRVKAVGVGNYSSSNYSETKSVSTTGLEITINAKKVTVNWDDDSPAADSVRYRAVGAAKWTVKKLAAGITDFSFNAAVGTNYEIEVLLDQQETNVLHGSAVVLDQPKLKADKAFIKDDTFQVNVTNYAAKNLAANAKQAILIVNGVQTTFNIDNQQGECDLANGGKVAFDNGRLAFSEMTSNTSYKVQISFSDGVSVSTVSAALTVKTLKSPYIAPVISSATAVSDTSITVTWETAYGKKSNTPAQKYTVQYSLDGVKWTNATTAATGNSFTIQKLKGGNVYQVRVLATKDAAFDASTPSEVLTAETLAAPKMAIEKNSIKDDSFQLNVTNYQTTNLPKATSINVKSDKYGETVINLENGAGSAAFADGMTVAFNNGALTFANVPSNTQQKIQVNFSNGVCTTAWSTALTVKTAIASYNKPVLTSATAVSSTSVQVEWSSAVGKNTNIQAQSYTIQYTTDGTRWINANVKVVGTSYTITGLTPDTKYLVAVIANKDALFNASLPSESQQVKTL